MTTDFIFDGEYASDYNVIIGFIGGNSGDIVSGGSIEFSVAKPPNSDKYVSYGSQRNEVLTWNFSIIKNFCKTDDVYFNDEETRKINKWLKRTDGFRWFSFCKDNEENVYYKVHIDVSPRLIGGNVAGFDLSVTSNCGYGFSELICKTCAINKENPYKFIVDSDSNDYILPYIKIKRLNPGYYYISNNSDLEQNVENNKESHFYNIQYGQYPIMDSENDIITNISNTSQFNWYFLRLVNGINIISTDSISSIDLEIYYREAREVTI